MYHNSRGIGAKQTEEQNNDEGYELTIHVPASSFTRQEVIDLFKKRLINMLNMCEFDVENCRIIDDNNGGLGIRLYMDIYHRYSDKALTFKGKYINVIYHPGKSYSINFTTNI